MKSDKRGFTLIELLVVIAIIGLLASIVLASLNSARKKSRDARRLADLKQLQNALELYANDNGGNYPTGTGYTATGGVNAEGATNLLALVGSYIPAIPSDPLGATIYYKYRTSATASATQYCLGANMENTPPTPADSCSGTTVDISGGSEDYFVGN